MINWRPKLRTSSIQWRLVISFFLVILIAAQLISVYFYAALERYYTNDLVDDLRVKASILQSSVKSSLENFNLSDSQRSKQINKLLRQLPILNKSDAPNLKKLIQVVDSRGFVIGSTADNHLDLNTKRPSFDKINNFYHQLKNGQKILVYQQSIVSSTGNQVIGKIYLEASLEETYRNVRQIFKYLIKRAVLIFIITSFLIILLARTLIKPIIKITNQAAIMAKGDFHTTLEIASNDELGDLASSLNNLSTNLRSALEQKEKLEEKQKEFVANVSHELRTPLTIIISYLEALEDGAINNKNLSTKFIDVTLQESERMTRLIEDLLKLSRLDSGQTLFNTTKTNLYSFIPKIINKFSVQAKHKNISLSYYINEGFPLMNIDQDKIGQVIDNLLSNAIMYTNEYGGIALIADQKEDVITIAIADSGIGIPQKDLEHLFERFYRVDKTRSRSLGGTGLGLSISEEIIKAHRGEINIESIYGKGTIVYFSLPIEKII